MIVLDFVPPLLTGLLCCATLWMRRSSLQRATTRRAQQLTLAARLMEQHGQALEAFLLARSAPPELKRMLIGWSDCLGDAQFVAQAPALLAQAPSAEMVPEQQVILDAINRLRSEHRELYDLFLRSAMAGAVAAVLRFSETAAKSEEIIAQLASDPQRELDVVVTVSRFRASELPFGLRPSVAAA